MLPAPFPFHHSSFYVHRFGSEVCVVIPRVFHQIWLGEKPIPEQFRKWADLWLESNPGWRMEWWTDKRCRSW